MADLSYLAAEGSRRVRAALAARRDEVREIGAPEPQLRIARMGGKSVN